MKLHLITIVYLSGLLEPRGFAAESQSPSTSSLLSSLIVGGAPRALPPPPSTTYSIAILISTRFDYRGDKETRSFYKKVVKGGNLVEEQLMHATGQK